MPELPEVTTTVTGLNETVRGKTITTVWTDAPNLFKEITPLSFARKIVGAKFKNTERLGKHILIHLSNKQTILAHMKMTGHFLYGKYTRKGAVWTADEAGPLRDDSYNKFVHIVFSLSNGNHLAFSDVRKFGTMRLAPQATLEAFRVRLGLGPDALGVSQKEFSERLLSKPNGKIKQVLMNQEVVAGIGNIYSDEMLWRSGIHPLRSPLSLSKDEWKKLYSAMRSVLKKGIDFGGDSDSDYRAIDGRAGKFQNTHEVYRRTGKKCRKDKTLIKRILVGGRSTHFCPHHQK